MATEWKHKRYFRVKDYDGNLKTFTSTADANTIIGFKAVYDTSTPIKTEVLADSDQTLVVTYEFNSEAEQTAFKSALHGAYTDDNSVASDTGHFTPADASDRVEHFKTEWLHKDGSVSATVNDIA